MCPLLWVGVPSLSSQSMGIVCPSLLYLWSHLSNLKKNTLICYIIEDISVSLCSKNSNLVEKTLQNQEKKAFFATLRGPPPPVWLRIYVQIHRSDFLKGVIMSQ